MKQEKKYLLPEANIIELPDIDTIGDSDFDIGGEHGMGDVPHEP